MNYIAHLHIADVTNTSFVGNLIADFGGQPQRDSELYQGWALHQMVDSLVDNHQVSLEYRQIERIGRRRFAGIVQDVFMDYWLIRHWSAFSNEPFERFSERVIEGLSQDISLCPPRLCSMVKSLNEYNWLPNLGTLEGIEKAIYSIQRRWRFGHHLSPFLDDIHTEIAYVESVFLALYPDVLAASAAFEQDQIKPKA
ncbi:ACP phosphodiesterase [Marinomonas balearica]|uniref:Acyl carrier protein phosphodiesterase n=1 Tax=Marinomonas balearica TaxID=491947 RepID=A0A4R6MFJ5_9GAMM|nr:ACP phosphodiesterase [Marinomonas balearica]TDO98869.1 acyl carrier protein phosphodiesterase [Marinomonas balearica]